MKETEIKQKDDIKIVSEHQIEKQLKFVGDMFIRPNQRCFEYNPQTGEVTLAKIECTLNPFAKGKTIDIYSGTTQGENRFEQKVITKDGFLYTVALNKNNAKRKFGL